MQSKRVGNIGEAITLTKFVELGVPVYIPFGDNESADLIAEFNGKLNKIQVKTSYKMKKDGFTVDLRSGTIRNGHNYFKKYDCNDIDYFSIYNVESKILMLIPIEKLQNRNAIKVNVPFKETHNQYEPLNYEDFSFEKIINI
jgi:hypothetical protein